VNNRADKYFVLAEQYLETTKLLLNTIIENENKDIGVGNSEKEALMNMYENTIKSDVYLFIPAMFICLQTVELFAKGLVLFKGKEIKYQHEVDGLLDDLRTIYGDKAVIVKKIRNFYKNQMEILKEFKKTNHITTIKELYQSLRYPEYKNKEYKYDELKHNGKVVLSQYVKNLEKLEEIKTETRKILGHQKN